MGKTYQRYATPSEEGTQEVYEKTEKLIIQLLENGTPDERKILPDLIKQYQDLVIVRTYDGNFE